MMLYPAMSDLLAKVPSRYKLVNVVAARARRIASDARQQEVVLDDKPVSIAIREIAQGGMLLEMPEISDVPEVQEISEVLKEPEMSEKLENGEVTEKEDISFPEELKAE